MIASSPKTERYRRSLRPLSRRSSMPSIATLAPESPSACPSTNARKSIRPTSKSLANNSRSTRSIRSPESAACSTYRRIFSSRVWVLRKAGSCETIMALGSVRMGWFSHTPFHSPRPNNFSSAGTACMQWLTPRKIRHKRPLRRPGQPRFASYAPFEFNLEEPFSHGSHI